MAPGQTKRDTLGDKGVDRYLELVRRFPLRPIRADGELDRAIAVINSLIDQDELNRDEQDYLEVLGDLVSSYEKEHHPLPPVSDADMLRHLIESRDTTQAKTAAATGIAESTVSDILAGRRGMNRKHIEALAKFFGVSPMVFMQA